MSSKHIKRVQTEAEAIALMYFLAKEQERHLKDVEKCRKDMLALNKKWGIEIPKDVDPDVWVEP